MIGEKIKAMRLARSIAQQDLATALGTTKQAVSLYELGQRRLRPDQLLVIADRLGVQVCDLVDVSSEKRVEIETAREIIYTIDSILADGQMQGEQDEWVHAAKKLLENLIQQDLTAAITADGVSPTLEVPAKDSLEGREGRLQRKRVDELLLAFGGLNSAGQKSVMRHIRELTQVPAYQAQPYLSGFAPEDRQTIERELSAIKNARYELDAMDVGKMTPGKASAIASSARLLSGATDRLVGLLFKGQALDEPGSGE